MRYLAPILPLLAFFAAPCFAQDSATNAPAVRTLEEVVFQFGKEYLYRDMDESFTPYAIRVDAAADGGKTLTFSCAAERKSRNEDWIITNRTVNAVTLQVDSSGKVRELSRTPADESLLPPLWIFRLIFPYCEAAGVNPDTLSEISVDAATNLVLVVGTNAPVRVSEAEISRAEKAHFFKTIAGANRIVILDGGFDCCVPIEAIDKERVFAVITNAVEIAAFTSMIRFEDGPMSPPCMCCGYPGIDWWKGGERVALTALQHGEALRWRAFSGDCPFTKESSQAIARWFKEHLGIGTKDPPPVEGAKPAPASTGQPPPDPFANQPASQPAN